jgi:hypothetical protein
MKELNLKSLDLTKVKRVGNLVVSHPNIKPWDNKRNYLVRVTFTDNTTRTFTSHAHSSLMYGLGFTDGRNFLNYPLNGQTYLTERLNDSQQRNSFTFQVWEIEEKK